ncbi:MAG: DnaA/Hda family protein [Betaproteobacteria bacterium]|nr:DnaA/Hda family protein [Betaproteobacteria bacterium]
MTRQFALPIQQPPVPSLDNFVPGSNAELLARLGELAAGRCEEAVIYLWGAPGSGRSHLLQASARQGVTLADDVEQLGDTAQAELFSAINRARETGTTVLAAGAAPPAQLALREDLRSRLGWGLVYEVKPLTDAEKAVYLHAEAARRGLKLSDEVVWYLLTHVRRDMPSLGAILEHLDRASLEQHRALTLPLVREALRALEP